MSDPGSGQSDQEYWATCLEGIGALPQVPTDRPRPPVSGFLRGRYAGQNGEAWYQKLLRLSTLYHSSPFVILAASLQALLARYTLQDDVLIGLGVPGDDPEHGGPDPKHPSRKAGANILCLRTDLGGDPAVSEIMRRVDEVVEGARAHAEFPFSSALSFLPGGGALGGGRPLSVLLLEAGLPGGFSSVPLDAGSVAADCDLVFDVHLRDKSLSVSVDYDAELFDEASVARLVRHWDGMLAGFLGDSETPLGAVPFATPAERERALGVWSRSAAKLEEGCLHRLFEDQVKTTPDSVALVSFSRTEPRERAELTYAELNARANRMARRLMEEGVGKGSLVGLFLERDQNLVIAILAILKAGGAYVPLDDSHPPDRLALILDDSTVDVVVTSRALVDRLPESRTPAFQVDQEGLFLDVRAEPGPPVESSPDDLAYVIYTSGSTGMPKGVAVTHGNVTRLFPASERWFGFDASDVWTLFHSAAFDFSVWEMWGALLHGGRLVVVPYLVSRDPQAFLGLLESERVTILNQTPSAFKQLMVAENRENGASDLSLRLVIFGGEALEIAGLRPWVDRHGDEKPRLINMYGITETTVHVTYRRITREDVMAGSGSMIGVPLEDLAVYVLDQGRNPVPLGVPGEMFVAGAGVSRGYLNRPELTGERFVPNPFGPGEGRGTLYRTGDLARIRGGTLPDLEYLGRADQQVKIRGFRVELGEIENVLASHPRVREAVALSRPDRRGQTELVAYLVPSESADDLIPDAAGWCRRKLPDYMVPTAFELIEEIPLTPNGKLDRNSLPEPRRDRAPAGAAYAGPGSDLETRVRKVYRLVLGINEIGLDDNFFELGGDSLLVGEVAGALREEFGQEIQMITVFENPTVRTLAGYLGRKGGLDPDLEVVQDRAEKRRGAISRRRAARKRGSDV